jgi:hypothetical protein
MQAATGEKVPLHSDLDDTEMLAELLEVDGQVAWHGQLSVYFGWNTPRVQLLHASAAAHDCSAFETSGLVGQPYQAAAAKKEASCFELPAQTCPWRRRKGEGGSLQRKSIRGRWRRLRTRVMKKEGKTLPVRLVEKMQKIGGGVSYNAGCVYEIRLGELGEVDLHVQLSRVSFRWLIDRQHNTKAYRPVCRL